MSEVASALSKMMDIIKLDEEIQALWMEIWRIQHFKLKQDIGWRMQRIRELTRKRTTTKQLLRYDIKRIEKNDGSVISYKPGRVDGTWCLYRGKKFMKQVKNDEFEKLKARHHLVSLINL
jgi:hypothetical protein